MADIKWIIYTSLLRADTSSLSLATEHAEGKVYELAGDEAYTLKELAAEVSEQINKVIPYNNLPEGEYAKVLISAGVPESYAQAIAQWDKGHQETICLTITKCSRN